MSHRRPRPSGAELALLALLAAWALFPLVIFLVRAAQLHGVYTGADGLIGADGVLGVDQLQYLAWARDAAHHGLVSDLFTLEPNGHVYLQPVFLLVGLLSRIGLSLPLAYQLIKPFAVLALFAAAVVWCGRFIEGMAARAAAVALALFMALPIAALYSWTGAGASSFRFSLYLLSDELLAAGKLWGYLPSALGLALVPVALLAVARSIGSHRFGSSQRRARAAGEDPRAWLIAGLASLGASWLHPWQGVTLIVIFVALALWRRADGLGVLILGMIGAGLPLAYYWLLSHTDPAWTLASHYEVIARLPAIVLLAGLGPVLALAALGLARPGDDPGEQMLLLWPLAAVVTYFANDAFAEHALQGLSFPLAVLMVRGGLRTRLPVAAGLLVVLVFSVPGLAFNARKMIRTATGSHVQYVLTSEDASALALGRCASAARRNPRPHPVRVRRAVPHRSGGVRRPWLLEPGLRCPRTGCRPAV